MITSADLLASKYNLLHRQFAVIIDQQLNVLWQSEQMYKLSMIDANNKVNVLNENDQLWQYFFIQLQLHQKGNLLLPISDCNKETIYHIAGVCDEEQQLYVITLTVVSESVKKNHQETPNLLNYFRQGIIITTINHSIVHFNQNLEKMIPKQFIQCGLNMKQLFLNQIIQVHDIQQFKEAMINHGMYKGEGSVLGKNIKFNCFFNEDNQQYIYIFEDVSEVMQLQKRLDEKEYLSEIGKMTSTLVHEMRNPMTCIKGYVDIMLMEQKPNSKYMSIIERELSHLTHLCSDILFLSKPIDKTGKGVNLLQIVQEVMELMEMEVKNKLIDLKFNCNQASNYIVPGNEMYFKQVVLNIIKNAVQAIDVKGIVEVALYENIHSVEFVVKDTGCGMNQQELENIFDMFYTTKEYGTGLGLPVVKKIIDQLNGKIEVKSTENIGTKFTIQFPTIH